MSRRSSPIWKISAEELAIIVNKSTTITQVLSYFGLQNKGSNFRTLKKRFAEDSIDFSSLKLWIGARKGIRFGGVEPLALSSILVEHSTYNRNRLKLRLIKEGILKNICYICNQLPEWNGKSLSLQLDHINGISDDNRIENLRILCPHCHSQTNNFAGRSKRKIQPLKPIKIKKARKNKIVWPNDLELVQMVKDTSFSSTGRTLGVSDNSVRKRIKLRNLIHMI